MPELPEVETIKNLLKPQLINKKIVHIDVLREKTILGDASIFKHSLENQTFIDISRIGKFLIFHLTNNMVFISHLRMEGKYFQYKIDEPNTKHARVVFILDDGNKIIYDDSRCFGILKLSTEDNYKNEEEIAKLGPEPFDIKDVNYLINKTKRSSLPIKSTLLDQTIMTGLGNIYVDETLFRSKVHPLRKANSVTKKEWEAILANSILVLNESIKAGGSTIRSYHPGKGIDGNFQTNLLCYGKKGEHCPDCGHVFHFIKVGGRGTTFCPMCQIEKKDKIIIGITGRIASGKSSVLEYVKSKGYSCISSDDIVAILYQTNRDTYQKIQDKLGVKFNSDHVEKDVLREHLIKHPKDKSKLEKIVHPMVYEYIKEWVNNQDDGLLFIEVPLLYESKMQDYFDFIIALDIDLDKQQERIKKRNESSYNQLLLINGNNSFDNYSRICDFLISNNKDIKELRKNIDKVINTLQHHLS